MSEWLGVLWITGVNAYLMMNLLRALRGHCWLRRHRGPLPDDAQADLAGLLPAYGLRCLPRIWTMEGVSQPFVWGLLRGNIYVPPGFLRIESSAHRRNVLAHELSHILRRDPLVNALQVIAQGLFWFHPLVWWANRRIRQEREKACDEMVVAHLNTRPKDYSSAIVRTLIQAQESTRAVPSLAIAGPVKNIEERIRAMLRPGKKFYKRPSLITSITIFAVALLAVPTTLVMTARAQTEALQPQVPVTPPLHQAAAAGDVEKIKSLLSGGVNVDETDDRGWTALHWASANGHTEVAAVLLSRRAYINAQGWGETPLHYAVQNGHILTVELLLGKGADVNAMQSRGSGRKTPLYYAVRNGHVQIMKLLISKGANVTMGFFAMGETPLFRDMGRIPNLKEVVELLVSRGAKVPESHLAIYSGDMEKLEKCLHSGTDINAQESYWGTALHAAANVGRKDMAEFLLSQGAQADAKDDGGLTPLYYAVMHNHEDVVDLLLAKGADINAECKNYPLLCYAIWHYNTDAAKLLLRKGADVNVGDPDGYTPLVNAIWDDDNGDQKSMVELFLAAGADVNGKDRDGHTPLYYAAMQGSKVLVELLTAKGATPVSTLHLAARAGDLAKVKSLVENGADVNGRDVYAQTPLFAAILADTPDVAEFLIARGADVNARDDMGATPLNSSRRSIGSRRGHRYIKSNMVELLLAKGADANAKDKDGRVALHDACADANKAVAGLLLAKGADVDLRDNNGRTALFHACLRGTGPAEDVTELLIAKGARIDVRDNYGSTPLHAACKGGDTRLVEMLIAKGADVNAKNDRYSVLYLAKALGREESAELLRKHGAQE